MLPPPTTLQPPPLAPLPPEPPPPPFIAMSGASITLTESSVDSLTVEPVPLTFIVSTPSVTAPPALTVIVDVPPPDVTDAGANAAVKPVGAAGEVSATFSATPVFLVTVTVTVALPPRGTDTDAGSTLI